MLTCLLGGFALTLAHEQVPARPILLSARVGALDLVALSDLRKICLEFTAGDVPPAPHRSILVRIPHPVSAGGGALSMSRRPFAPKLARHMLDSILLI